MFSRSAYVRHVLGVMLAITVVGAAVLLSLLNPLAAFLPFIDTGDSEEAKREAALCAELARRGNLSRAAAPKPAGR